MKQPPHERFSVFAQQNLWKEAKVEAVWRINQKLLRAYSERNMDRICELLEDLKFIDDLIPVCRECGVSINYYQATQQKGLCFECYKPKGKDAP